MLAKKNEELEFSPFPELLTEGFDRDQIWEEIATQNEPFLNYAKTTVTDFARKRKRSDIESELEDEESVSGESMELDEEEYEEFDGLDDNEATLDASDLEEEALDEQFSEEGEEDIEEEEEEEEEEAEVLPK